MRKQKTNSKIRKSAIMRKLHSTIVSIVLLTVVLMACGCGSSLRYQTTVLQDSELREELSSNLKSIYPERFKALHRVILSIYDKQIDATGYLMAYGNGEYRLLALGDFGNVFFDISSDNNKVLINKNLLKLSAKKFSKGVLKDIKATSLYVPVDQMQVAQMPDGHPVLRYTAEKETYLFIFNSNRLLEEYVILKGGQCIYKAQFKQWKQLPGLSNQVPIVIHTTNYKLHYSLVIDVIKFEETPFNLNTKDRQ